jgi:hypothetical protein
MPLNRNWPRFWAEVQRIWCKGFCVLCPVFWGASPSASLIATLSKASPLAALALRVAVSGLPLSYAHEETEGVPYPAPRGMGGVLQSVEPTPDNSRKNSVNRLDTTRGKIRVEIVHS